jgi:hypothetical protein
VSEKWPVSAGGGTKPRWRGAGGELFFLSGSNSMMSATIKRGTEFAPSVPQRLFALDVIGSDGWDYAVSDDGQRFMAMGYSGTGVEGSVSVIANWPATLR